MHAPYYSMQLHNKTGTGAPDISVEPTAATELPVATANSRPAAPARDAVQTRANEEYQDAGPPAEDRATSGQAEKAPRDAEVDEVGTSLVHRCNHYKLTHVNRCGSDKPSPMIRSQWKWRSPPRWSAHYLLHLRCLKHRDPSPSRLTG